MGDLMSLGEVSSSLLAGKTAIVTGASRGIGAAIAIRLAAEEANVTMIGRTTTPHPRYSGTIHTMAAEAEAAGGDILPIAADVRDDKAMADAVQLTIDRFGGIDMLLNVAAVIEPTPAITLTMNQYDHMQDINCRATLLMTKLCLPALQDSARAGRAPQVLNISPPINLAREQIGRFAGYTVSKYGTSLLTIGLAQELADQGIAVNSLWPRTTIDTAAVRNKIGGDQVAATSRNVWVMADAALLMLTRSTCTGELMLDEEVLVAHGIADLDSYRATPGTGPLTNDIFIDD
ncbi:SDR family oxidoreductase [Nocardia araoensis]|uniref:SDR family oxidoreductase n=1 Tax=Nocardia araoensis TaxID=228600 RepID=UPI001FE143A9|nr:SDR family oxidoreductase [Nocardia araoensis]